MDIRETTIRLHTAKRNTHTQKGQRTNFALVRYRQRNHKQIVHSRRDVLFFRLRAAILSLRRAATLRAGQRASFGGTWSPH